jgi:hypothetical protein
MSETKKRGRPATGDPIRDTPVRFFLSAEDAAWFSDFADKLGFKSHSHFWTAIAERLLVGRLAPFVWLKLGYLIGKRANETGISKGAGFYNPFEPLPPLPVEDRPRPTPLVSDEQLTPADNKKLLKIVTEIRKELQPK